MEHQSKTLNDIFDKIYVIHCVENEQRYKNITFQKEQGDIDLDIWWTCYHPWSDVMMNGMILSNACRYILNGNELNLMREFYTIIKTSYLKGYDHILIFEDDFQLMKKDYLSMFLDKMPEDFDIIQFSILFNPNFFNMNKIFNAYQNGQYFIKAPTGFWSNCGLALSKNGMKYFIDTIDKEMQAADIPIFEDSNMNKSFGKINLQNDLNHYISTVPLVYLSKNKSTVQTKENKDEELLYKYYQTVEEKYYNIYHYEND
jgi:hypothetical protein